jgi:hypothetical protein
VRRWLAVPIALLTRLSLAALARTTPPAATLCQFTCASGSPAIVVKAGDHMDMIHRSFRGSRDNTHPKEKPCKDQEGTCQAGEKQ